MNVYCVFFVNDANLSWELSGIYMLRNLAEAVVARADDPEEWKIEKWSLLDE